MLSKHADFVKTDDVGIFESSLSNEYALAMEHFELTKQDAMELSRNAVKCIFAGPSEKDRMNDLLDAYQWLRQ